MDEPSALEHDEMQELVDLVQDGLRLVKAGPWRWGALYLALVDANSVLDAFASGDKGGPHATIPG